MTKIQIPFYRKENLWFANVPGYIESGGTEDDLEMVFGADSWLDILSNYTNSVTLLLSTDKPLNERIVLYAQDNEGATYIAYTYKDEDINHILWLCGVTVWLFGDFPNIIYYEVTSTGCSI